MPKAVQPLQLAVQAKPHRPVYRMHRYFARRPYSVFAELVRHYSDPGDTILDPFCGGGVTLVEGALQGRRVIGFDVNPLATFVTQMELSEVDLDGLKEAQAKVYSEFQASSDRLFATTCRRCEEPTSAQWFEYSALTECESCSNTFVVSDAEKQGVGRWLCPFCQNTKRFSTTANTSFKLMNTFYKCSTCDHEEVVSASIADVDLSKQLEAELSLAENHGLWIPNEAIPDCNMQRESALFKKGIHYFRQLFSSRHLLALGLLKEIILKQRSPFQDWLLFAFSSTLRYTNRMVTRNVGWRGNRPLEWAKPGYWLPPVHLEANVLTEFSRRCNAVWHGKQDYISKLPRSSSKQPTLLDAMEDVPAFQVGTRSAANLPLPDDSVDVIITDPPYGSYVHYADLCNFWSVWLPEIAGLGQVIDDSDEAVVARKNFPGAKSTADYQRILERCFLECARVLKRNGYVVLTFNNREPRAWAALLVAALKAGFELPPNGLLFQDGIASYRHTAQSRRSGSVIGDFILSFRKPVGTLAEPAQEAPHVDWAPESELLATVEQILSESGPLPPDKLMAHLYTKFYPHLANLVRASIAGGNDAAVELLRSFDAVQLFDSHRRQLLEKRLDYKDGKWFLKEHA